MTHFFKRDVVRSARQQRGLSLVELLVAIAIGAVLIFGATQAYVDSRNAYTVNESVSRMQETARYAMSVLEPDIRMANYWGLLKGAEPITNKASKTDPVASFAGGAATDCGNNFGVDLENGIEGTDASYPTTAPKCKPFNDNRMPTSDTITVRRASRIPSSSPTAVGPLRVCSTHTNGTLATSSTPPLCAAALTADANDPIALMSDLIVNLYYVDNDSDGSGTTGNGIPSLRRQWLNPATKEFKDQEIIRNVEDLQVQFGVDRTGGFGTGRGAATQYLEAGTDLTNLLTSTTKPAQIVSVRIWLLVRADTPEVGFTDTRVYTYGSRTGSTNTGDLTAIGSKTKPYQPSLNSDNSPTGVKHYRRVLITRTIQLRNALGT